MHLNGPPHAPATAGAIRTLIPALRTRGLRFVTLRELLGSRKVESESSSSVGR